MTWRNGNPPDIRWWPGGLHPSGPGRDWWPKGLQERPMALTDEQAEQEHQHEYELSQLRDQLTAVSDRLTAATERAERYAAHIRDATTYVSPDTLELVATHIENKYLKTSRHLRHMAAGLREALADVERK